MARKVNYLSNKNIMPQVIASKQQGKMTDELAKMFMLLVQKYAKKGNWAGYSYNEDMQGYALMMLVRTWDKFDHERFDNPFAFYTQCIKNSFIYYLKKEKQQRNIRDELLVKEGFNPSYTYQLDHEKQNEDTTP